jgi:hypothetical protein
MSCGLKQSENSKKQIEIQEQKSTSIEFKSDTHNFGTMQAGEIAVFSFLFTNTGNENLWINHIDTGCGCMKVKYLKEPVKPNEIGKIEVAFNSSGLYGKQMKTITVDANVSKPKHLAIFAEVKNEQLEIKY